MKSERRKRANGTGSIYKRSSDDKWVAALSANGKNHSYYERNKTRARSLLRYLLIARDESRDLDEAARRWKQDFDSSPLRLEPLTLPRASKRLGISPRLRWQVLERDGFACCYCGRGAPEVQLHLDHVIPVAHGGSATLGNLRSACEDCNLGKGASYNPRLEPKPGDLFDPWAGGWITPKHAKRSRHE